MTTCHSTQMCECGCGGPAPLAQRTSKKFGHVAGQPVRFINGHQRRNPKPRWTTQDCGYITPCRLWGHGTVKGYGVVKVAGRTRYTHVVEWEAVNGPVPEGEELDHLCRQTLCGEPSHLDPVQHVINAQRGATAKLNAAMVLAIRASSESTAELADRYGVARRTINNVRSGVRWSNIVAPSGPVAALPYAGVPVR